jgi:hypothetical protein
VVAILKNPLLLKKQIPPMKKVWKAKTVKKVAAE